MRAKVSKAQTEVWEWKESLYNKTKDLSLSERIEYLIKQAQMGAVNGKKDAGKK